MSPHPVIIAVFPSENRAASAEVAGLMVLVMAGVVGAAVLLGRDVGGDERWAYVFESLRGHTLDELVDNDPSTDVVRDMRREVEQLVRAASRDFARFW